MNELWLILKMTNNSSAAATVVSWGIESTGKGGWGERDICYIHIYDSSENIYTFGQEMLTSNLQLRQLLSGPFTLLKRSIFQIIDPDDGSKFVSWYFAQHFCNNICLFVHQVHSSLQYSQQQTHTVARKVERQE